MKKGDYNGFSTVKGNSAEAAHEHRYSNNVPKEFNRDVYAVMQAWKDCHNPNFACTSGLNIVQII